MELLLSHHGTSFATRERARELVATLPGTAAQEELLIGLDGVTASPSFMAELLTRLSSRFLSMSIEGGSEHLRGITFSLVERLGLGGRVRDLAKH